MTEIRKININKIMSEIERVYGDSDLFTILEQYAEKAERAIGKKIKYSSFFDKVHNIVIPDKISDPDKIAAIMTKGDITFSFREISLFYDYATVWALIGLNIPFRSDRELCDTVEYLKTLHHIDPDEIMMHLSEAERILYKSKYFYGSDNATKNACRNNVAGYAEKFSISETEAAKILCSSNPLKEKKSIASKIYFPSIWIICTLFFLLAAFLTKGNIALSLLLILPLSELSKEICDALFSRIVKYSPIPRLKLSSIPDEAPTICVITSLLTSEKDAKELSEKIRNCYFANRDKNAYFGLLCDLKEANTSSSPEDERLIAFARECLESLNSKYGCEIYLFVRSRRFSATEGKYMGWERKRGAVIELTRLLRGKNSSISVLCGDPVRLSGMKYVITLDSDTRLYNGAIRDMVGSMLHPANTPVIENGRVVSGHAIMQPRMEASLESAEKTPFSVLSAGNGGTDIYASAAYETYQSIFGEGIFCGKGIFDVTAFSEVIDGAFPDESVLSHDLLEGTRLRAAALTDISLTDNLPKNPLSCLDRQHRWIRGDVQALMFTGKYVQNSKGKLYRNPISNLSKYKIHDNIRRSLVPIAAAAAVLWCIFLPENTASVTLMLALSYLIFPCLISVIFLLKSSGRRFFSYVMPGVFHAVGNFLYAIASLLQNALISADAVLRAGFRMLFSRKHMLEWKTASEAEKGINGLPLYLYKMLPSLLAGAAVLIFCPAAAIKAIGALWVMFPFAAYLIGKEFSPAPHITKSQKNEITGYAEDIWKFFSEKVTAADSYLPPDNFQLSPAEITAHRTSPTNIGLYLLSCAAAKDFGFITLSELISRLKNAIDSIEKMQKWNGHLYNWYNTQTLDILGSPYVSTVDSGNFITCLVALYYSLDDYDDGTRRISELSARIAKLISETDFSPLFDKRKKLFRIGISTASGEVGEGCYDIFISEARTTSYYAIASGQVPREHWSRLSRPLISRDGYIGLASWTGTMFEYMMPALLLPTRFGSLSYEALSFAVREQKADSTSGVWGRSESGYFMFDPDLNYQYKAFGAASLGMKRGLEKDNVISPYSSFLCLCISPGAVLENLKNLKNLGMYGQYGFYEALDFTPARVGKGYAIIRSYMSHHIGMSMISCANACFGGVFVKRFMKSPEMASSAELLEEKIPINADIAKHIIRRKNTAYHPLSRNQVSRIIKTDHSPSPAMPYASVISENGITVTGSLDILKFSVSGIDISVDPFIFGEIHRPRLLFSADGKIYDALSGTMSRGAIQNKFIFRLDEKELMAEVSVSVSGKNKCFAISLDVRGHFRKLYPLFCFEPCLSPAHDREAHPAYSDIMISAEYLEAESLLLYTKKQKNPEEPDLCLAVSFESHGGKESYQTSRDILGLMYSEKDFEKLFTEEFNAPCGAVINPFCAVKKESESQGGRYIGNILMTVGESRSEAVASLFAARKEIHSSKYKNAAVFFSEKLLRTTEERLNVCGAQGDFSRYAELMFTCAVRKRNAGKAAVTHSIGELWRYGISGDIPVFCLDIKDTLTGGSPVRRILSGFISAHKYLALSGIKSDLVLMYKSDGDYGGTQLAALRELCEETASTFMIGHSNGIFLIDGGSDVLSAVSVLYAEIDRESTLDGICTAYIRPVKPREEIIAKPPIILRPTENSDGLPVYGGSFMKKGFAVYKGSQSTPWSYVYAMNHFGTLVTQNSLGYTWIGNSHERRITLFNGDNLLDFSGERLIYTEEGQEYDLCACAYKVFFGRGAAEYWGSINQIDYKVTVTIGVKLPCKIITVEIPDDVSLEYRIIPVMGEKTSASKPISKIHDGDTIRFVPRITSEKKYDTGFLTEKRFPGKRVYILGAYPSGGEAVFSEIKSSYSTEAQISSAEAEYEAAISYLLPSFNLKMNDPYLAEMTGYYLPYQALVCRFFGRTGFYQSGGAYGFRDQLQDCLCIMHGAPSLARTHILRCAAHQYEEGDVMHWWHTVYGTSKGVRTRYSDDYLWLPYITAEYILFTEDRDILDVNLPYLSSPLLNENESDRYETPEKSKFSESLYSHCARAIEHALTFGAHELPFIGGGDWNDGMNHVGADGGESVWLGFFLISVLERFIPIAAGEGDLCGAAKYRDTVNQLKKSCEKAFNGDRFIRAYYGDGTPVGGEDFIDTLPQAFSALSGINRKMSVKALKTAVSYLFEKENRIFRLLSPAYEKDGEHNPGYIAAYPAGIRENGGQYTHAAVWTAMGCAEAEMPEICADILKTINPASICSETAGALRYRGEPYFLAGDVSANPAVPGRCGWSLYTGAAGWFWIAVTETLMGFHFTPEYFTVSPALSEHFPAFGIKFTIKGTEYTVLASLGERNSWMLDGKSVNNLFYFDKNSHLLEITVEKKDGMR